MFTEDDCNPFTNLEGEGKKLSFFFVSAVLSVDFFLILSVQVRLSATSLSEVALKVWQAPCTLSASVGPASQTELSASAALALCVLWDQRAGLSAAASILRAPVGARLAPAHCLMHKG